RAGVEGALDGRGVGAGRALGEAPRDPGEVLRLHRPQPPHDGLGRAQLRPDEALVDQAVLREVHGQTTAWPLGFAWTLGWSCPLGRTWPMTSSAFWSDPIMSSLRKRT